MPARGRVLWGEIVNLRVDSAALRSFAGALSEFSGDVRGIDAPAAFAGAASALPGTAFDTTVKHLSDVTAAALAHVGSRIDSAAKAAAGSAGNYDITEATFVDDVQNVGRQL